MLQFWFDVFAECMNVISPENRFDTDIRVKSTRVLSFISSFARDALTGERADALITLLMVLPFVLFVGRHNEIAVGVNSVNVSARRGNAETSLSSTFASSDCRGRVPKGYTRIFIADRSDAKSGTGVASDPFDGSTAQKFDTILRTRSESGVTNIVVCIGPGNFQTEGTHDYVVGVGHLNKTQPGGFTVNRGWKIHGESMDRTILTLSDLYLDLSTGKYLVGHIISTYGPDSHGVEVSDLTLDDNYPALKRRYQADLQLEAVLLRSNLGHHWIHNLHVVNAAGESTESFPVEISSDAAQPTDSNGNVVEYVTMDHWGSGKCTAIAIANAVAEVRFNRVFGHHIAYGGWLMSNVHFHNNYAIDDVYGFNVDSLINKGIVISGNQIIHPKSYGMVIGGIGQFVDFSITENTITLAASYPWNVLYGIVFQGNVSGVRVSGNLILGDQQSSAAQFFALFEKGAQNSSNVFQNNRISNSFRYALQGADCIHGNVDQNGRPLRGLKDTQRKPCLTGLEHAAHVQRTLGSGNEANTFSARSNPDEILWASRERTQRFLEVCRTRSAASLLPNSLQPAMLVKRELVSLP